jgi:hypothetical protein
MTPDHALILSVGSPFRQLDSSQTTVLAAVRSRRSLAHQDSNQASGRADAPLFSRSASPRWAPGNGA